MLFNLTLTQSWIRIPSVSIISSEYIYNIKLLLKLKYVNMIVLMSINWCLLFTSFRVN